MKDAKPKNLMQSKEFLKLVQYIEETDYGSVTVIIQNKKIVQIEKNEKIRFKTD